MKAGRCFTEANVRLHHVLCCTIFPRADSLPYMLSRSKDQRKGSCSYYTQIPNVTGKTWKGECDSFQVLIKGCSWNVVWAPRGLGVLTLLSSVFLTFIFCNFFLYSRVDTAWCLPSHRPSRVFPGLAAWACDTRSERRFKLSDSPEE